MKDPPGALLSWLNRPDVLVHRFVLAELLGPPRAAAWARRRVAAAPSSGPAASSGGTAAPGSAMAKPSSATAKPSGNLQPTGGAPRRK